MTRSAAAAPRKSPAPWERAGRASVVCGTGYASGGAGAFFSRPYGDWAAMAYGQATTTTILHRKVKNIFDPGNVLNPGKLCF